MALSAKIERAPGMTRAPNLCQPMDQHRSASKERRAFPLAAQERQMARRFNMRQRIALKWAYGRRCVLCGKPLDKNWHADHKKAWSKGGATTCANGQSTCPECNLRKGSE